MDDLTLYRIKTANEKLLSAELLMNAGQYKDSISRSYYAMFSAVRAVLAKDGVDFSKHSGVLSYFQKEYIKTNLFDKKYSKYITTAFQFRNNCDYNDFFLVSKEDAMEQYEHAKEMCGVIEKFLNK